MPINKTLEYDIEKALYLAEKTCTSPTVLEFSEPLPGVSIHFHELITILSVVACLVNTLISFFLLCGHLYNFTKPKEQKQIVRIILFVPFLSICCFFSVYFYGAQPFIIPVGQCYEGFAITAIFLLYVQLVTPDVSKRAHFFDQLERRWATGRSKGSKGSLRWFQGIWIMVFQITVVRIGYVIATEVLFSVTCPLSPARNSGNIALSAIQSVSTAVSVSGVILFETRLRPQLEEYRGLFKLLSLKGVVLFQSVQEIIFPILAEEKIFFPKPPYHVSWNDFARGLPEFILVWELLIVAVMFLWSFEFAPYQTAAQTGVPIAMSPVSALLHSLNTGDVWDGVVSMFRPVHTLRRDDSEAAEQHAMLDVPKPHLQSADHDDEA